MIGETDFQERLRVLLPHLNEKQQRWLAALEAKSLGYGGISTVSRLTGLSRVTLHKAQMELRHPGRLKVGRVRAPGGGRRRISSKHPEIERKLRDLVEATTRGDPESLLLWTCKSTRELARSLGEHGFSVTDKTVGSLLKEMSYSLQGNLKTIEEGASHPARDQQFQHLHAAAKSYARRGDPVISVDTKKKELIGRYLNKGRTWRPQGKPEQVLVHDFIDPAVPKAIPYGVYDVGRNEGWVNVGCDHDTATFAIESIRRWWRAMGQPVYPDARTLLICADSGGSNGYRIRLWKVELQKFVDETRLNATVCHLPPGTSKWNKIEHRLFSHISMNWRGRPLISHEVVVKLIGKTKTRTGLKVRAKLDKGTYPTKVKVSDEAMEDLNIEYDCNSPNPKWNYTIRPRDLKPHKQ
jgi:hypothetical protein